MARSRSKAQTSDSQSAQTGATATPANEAPVSATSAQAPAGRSNAAAQEQLVGRRATSGFKGDIDQFKGRMEWAFGTSFSAVELVDGEEGEAGLGAGALATLKSNRIYVGQQFGALSLDDQEFVLSHELAHSAQQRGGAGGASVDPEADADRAAAGAMSGESAETQATIGAGGAHNFDLAGAWQSVQDTVAEGAEMAAQWALEQIASAAQLLAFIEQFGLEWGKKAVDFLLEHKVEILVSFLTLSPASGLVVYIVRRLPFDTMKAWLSSTEAKTAALVLGAVIAAGAIALVAPLLIAIGPIGRGILKELGGPTIALLWEYAPESFKTMAIDFLVETWPEGVGFDVEAHIGATFGYPIYLGVDSFASLAHFTRGEFKLTRGGFLVAAFDTGVGVGGFIGTGGKSKGGGGKADEGGLGIGGEAAAEFMAGYKLYALQEFMFPVAEDGAFASLLLTVLGLDMTASMALGGLISDSIKKVNPLGYLTKMKTELKEFAEGNAGAQAGVRRGGENDTGGSWNQQEGVSGTGSMADAGLWKWIRASVAGRLAAEAGVGMEVEQGDFSPGDDGNRRAHSFKLSLYGEASAAASISHAIPVISRAIPAGFNWDGGLGVRAVWNLTWPNGQESATGPTDPTWEIYGKSGDMDRYNGAASEVSLGLANLTPDTFADYDTFLSNLQGAKIIRRVMVGDGVGPMILGAFRQGAFHAMLPKEYKQWGCRLEGYLDVEAAVTADDVRAIFNAITAMADHFLEGGEPLQQLWLDLQSFFATGEGPEEITNNLTFIADTILAGLKKLHLHGLFGLSGGAGGRLSAGAKVRLDARIGAQITYDKNLLEYVDGQLDTQDIEDLLTGALESAQTYLDLPATETAPTEAANDAP